MILCVCVYTWGGKNRVSQSVKEESREHDGIKWDASAGPVVQIAYHKLKASHC